MSGIYNTSSDADEGRQERDPRAAAYAYVEADIPIFPLNGKRPIYDGGHKIATTDRDQIDRWLDDHLGCNWGMPTGVASGYDVLDIDGAEGLANLAAWEAEHGRPSR